MPIRRTILDELTSTVRSMLAQGGTERVLFMTGEAGIGKSTLIQQLLANLESDAKPPLVAAAECSTPVAGTGVGQVEALKPFADIMAGLVEAGSAAAGSAAGGSTDAGFASGQKKAPRFKLDFGKFFVDTAPSWIGLIPIMGAPIFHALTIVGSGYDQFYLHNKLKSQGAGSASNQEQVFRQYINFLSKLSLEVPLLIVLDDFHWADTSSTNLLFAASRDLGASSVVFVVVYRNDDVKRSSTQDEHPLMHVRNEIERYGLSKHIEIPRAELDDMQALILAQYPDYASNPELERWLLKITDGNLLFATQFLSVLEHELYLEPGSASLLKDLSNVSVPSSANAVIAEQIRRLKPDDKEQLRYASVEGETITARMVSRFLDLPMLKMIQRLRMLSEQHHVLRSLGTQSLYAKETTAYQFVHHLVHKTLYDELTIEERKILHGIASDVLEEELALAEAAQHNVHVVAARLAAHASIAERHETAARALLTAARWVWRSYSVDEALTLLGQCERIAYEHAELSTTMQSVALDALLLQAGILRHRARYKESAVCYEDAVSRSNKVGNASQRCEAYLGLSTVKRSLSRFVDAEADAHTALVLATEEGDASNRVRALLMIGNGLSSRSKFDEAEDYYQQSLDAATAIGDPQGQAAALGNIGNLYDDRGLIEKALEFHQQGLAIHRERGDMIGVTRGLQNIGSALHTGGRLDEAIACYDEALTLARSSGDLRMEPTILHNMSIARRQQERFDESLDLILRCLATNEQIGDRSGVATALCEIGNVYVDLNRIDDAMEYFTRSEILAQELSNDYAVAVAQCNIGYANMLSGRLPEAVRAFESSRILFANLGVKNCQHEAAFGSACCALRLERMQTEGPLNVKSAELLDRTRALVSEADFTPAEYERVLRQWPANLKKLGMVVQA